MRSCQLLLIASSAAAVAAACSSSSSLPFPSSMIEFSADFKQPQPPVVKPEFTAKLVQHKWNENVSHIMAGYIDNSPSQGFVRVNEVYDDKLASSLFDYTNTTEDGLVDNILTTYDPQTDKPDVWRGYVNSNYPAFKKDILVETGAVFEGLVRRKFIETPVAAWSIMYQGAIPVTVFVTDQNVIVGYDYFSPELRTRVVTDFFDIQVQ